MFRDKIEDAWATNDSLVCVGLDPEESRLPTHLCDTPRSYFSFLTAVVDATADFCAAFKPQAAHFAAQGREQELQDLIAYIKTNHPQHLVILDAKRGDIGSTAAYYAKEAYQRYGADAVTLNPYLGKEAIEPFLEYADKGVVILCRTSNADSDWLQNHGSPPVFHRVAQTVAEWNQAGQCMLVAGATYPQELGQIRQLAPEVPLLVPGIGAQGGDLAAVLSHGLDTAGHGLLISSSRAILYASLEDDFAERSADAARQLHEQINEFRSK